VLFVFSFDNSLVSQLRSYVNNGVNFYVIKEKKK